MMGVTVRNLPALRDFYCKELGREVRTGERIDLPAEWAFAYARQGFLSLHRDATPPTDDPTRGKPVPTTPAPPVELPGPAPDPVPESPPSPPPPPPGSPTDAPATGTRRRYKRRDLTPERRDLHPQDS